MGTEDEMLGWHHRPNGHESEYASGDGEGQGNLACCSPRGGKESDTTERRDNLKGSEGNAICEDDLHLHSGGGGR